MKNNAMNQSDKAELPKDESLTKKSFAERFKEALSKPVTLVIAALVFLSTISAEYVFSRVMDAIWEVEPSEEVIKLNTELQSTSGQLKSASKDLEHLILRIDQSKVEDPKLRDQLGQLDKKLVNLNELVKNASQKTDKVATISEALQDDWKRLKNKSDGNIDSLPDLTLGKGEGVQLCGGLASLGVTHLQNGNVWVTIVNKKKTLSTGARVALDDKSYVDYIGTKNKKALFKVNCGNK